MSDADTETATDIISRITHEREYGQGITLPAFGGLAADSYLRRYGADRTLLAHIPKKSHANARANPYAQFNSDISVSEILSSPLVADPLRLYDCCPTSDGAAAAIVSADRGDVLVEGCESAVGSHAVGDRRDPLAIPSVRTAGRRAYEAAGTGPDGIDVACLHDAFSILEWLEMEELGFADRGKAWQHTRDGHSDLDGALPINPGGGLKARGHPLGATGLSQVIELVWQIRGETPSERAVDADRGLAVNVAGFGNNAVCTVLRGET
jgi:acetyl-CoA C-acetyltransferase/acetyl-CoA acyltransferase